MEIEVLAIGVEARQEQSARAAVGQAEGVEMSPSKGLKFQFLDVICAVFPNNTTMLLKIFI